MRTFESLSITSRRLRGVSETTVLSILKDEGVTTDGPVIDIQDALYGWAREHGHDEDDSSEFACFWVDVLA